MPDQPNLLAGSHRCRNENAHPPGHRLWLRIQPASDEEKPEVRRTQSDRWALNYSPAKQYCRRERHLQVPMKRIERIVGKDREEGQLRLGTWIGNQRRRVATPCLERVGQLPAVGMR
ncbi:helicase associated domain-containing protein [Streptomyces sp. NPDC001250]|uniref:helicase associated domain-containing protein n=1 Tax=unclassified Streptomyces TaxID=2593676 RepID=UPI003326AF61